MTLMVCTTCRDAEAKYGIRMNAIVHLSGETTIEIKVCDSTWGTRRAKICDSENKGTLYRGNLDDRDTFAILVGSVRKHCNCLIFRPNVSGFQEVGSWTAMED